MKLFRQLRGGKVGRDARGGRNRPKIEKFVKFLHFGQKMKIPTIEFWARFWSKIEILVKN